MSYRYPESYQPQQAYQAQPAARRTPSARPIMAALLATFVVVSLLVLLAGRVPFVPDVVPLSGPTYRDYVIPDRQLLDSYGFTTEGRVHIPIERAMDLVVERGLPTSESATASP
jgi:hypothetical protein